MDYHFSICASFLLAPLHDMLLSTVDFVVTLSFLYDDLIIGRDNGYNLI